MSDTKESIREQIEQILQDIGGFTWEQAETWAGFCDAVGMDPEPFLKVMMDRVCKVKTAKRNAEVPSACSSAELWVVLKGNRTNMKVVEP